MELVVTEIKRGIDRPEWFEINVDLPLLPFGSQDFTTVDDKAIGRNLVVELEPLLGRSNGRQHRLTVDTRLDVRGCSVLFGQHLCST